MKLFQISARESAWSEAIAGAGEAVATAADWFAGITAWAGAVGAAISTAGDIEQQLEQLFELQQLELLYQLLEMMDQQLGQPLEQ